MRWQPDTPVCAECGFDWSIPRGDAVSLVSRLPEAAAAAMGRISDPMQRAGGRWSASMYLWHLVDVLRIGSERLLTLAHDPRRGIACWDENALAEARRYQHLSPAAGLLTLRSAARDWAATARTVPDGAEAEHPRFGILGALDIIRRNAHEAQHHLADINRYGQR